MCSIYEGVEVVRGLSIHVSSFQFDGLQYMAAWFRSWLGVDMCIHDYLLRCSTPSWLFGTRLTTNMRAHASEEGMGGESRRTSLLRVPNPCEKASRGNSTRVFRGSTGVLRVGKEKTGGKAQKFQFG